MATLALQILYFWRQFSMRHPLRETLANFDLKINRFYICVYKIPIPEDRRKKKRKQKKLKPKFALKKHNSSQANFNFRQVWAAPSSRETAEERVRGGERRVLSL